MAYDLDQFIADCRSILARDPGPEGREQVRVNLERLLRNPDFVASIAATTRRAACRCFTRTRSSASRCSRTSTTRRACRRRTITARRGRSTARPRITPT